MFSLLIEYIDNDGIYRTEFVTKCTSKYGAIRVVQELIKRGYLIEGDFEIVIIPPSQFRRFIIQEDDDN